MRISDWSSDVCSSDLPIGFDDLTLFEGCHGGGIKVSVACRGVPSEKNAGEEGESDNTDPGWISARLTIRIKAIVVQDSRGCLNWIRRSKMNAHKDSLSDRWPALLRNRRSEEHTSELQSLMRNSYAV